MIIELTPTTDIVMEVIAQRLFEHTDLVEAYQRDLTHQERKDQANILTRWKWKLTGVPVKDGSE